LSDKGAFHTSDIPWLFGAEGSYYSSSVKLNCSWTESENNFSREIITMWTRFAKTGKPTENDSWLRYTESDKHYLNLRADNIQLLQTVRPDYVCDFWDEENARLIQKYFPEDNINSATEVIENTSNEVVTEVTNTTFQSEEVVTQTQSIPFDEDLKQKINFIFQISVAATAVITFIVALIVAITCPVKKQFYY